MEEDNKEIREEQNEEIKEEQQAKGKKKLLMNKKLTTKEVLITVSIGILAAVTTVYIVYNYFEMSSDLVGLPDKKYPIQAFNSQFEIYETLGDQTISGQQVESLIETFRASNIANGDHKVSWKGGTDPQPIVNGRYKVKLYDNDNDGYIDTIDVERVYDMQNSDNRK